MSDLPHCNGIVLFIKLPITIMSCMIQLHSGGQFSCVHHLYRNGHRPLISPRTRAGDTTSVTSSSLNQGHRSRIRSVGWPPLQQGSVMECMSLSLVIICAVFTLLVGFNWPPLMINKCKSQREKVCVFVLDSYLFAWPLFLLFKKQPAAGDRAGVK